MQFYSVGPGRRRCPPPLLPLCCRGGDGSAAPVLRARTPWSRR